MVWLAAFLMTIFSALAARWLERHAPKVMRIYRMVWLAALLMGIFSALAARLFDRHAQKGEAELELSAPKGEKNNE
jgi:uncharacterized membrane protein YjjB (DUF3815 family)